MSLKVEAFEALCSAIYMMPFSELLGETEIGGHRTAWFHLGDKPKDIRVGIIMPNVDEVRVHIEWKNYANDARNPLKGEQTITMITYGADQQGLMVATQNAILRILEVYREVLAEEGVAGLTNLVGDGQDPYDPEEHWPEEA